MTEYLLDKTLEKSNLKDCDINSGKDDLPKYDIVLETLKHIRPRSKLKKHLAYILSLFYSCQIAIPLISFLFGFFSLGLPLLIIYNNLVKSIIIPILIIPIFSLLYSLILIIISVLQATKRKVELIEKWERKNILKNIGAIITSIIIIVSLSLLYQFYSQVILDSEKEDIIVDYEESTLSENFTSDFVFKYILNMISFDSYAISNENNKKKIQYYFNGDEIINLLRHYLKISLIPLLILSFNKVVKSLIIKVKHTIGQLICFLGCFFFCLFNIIINSYTNETIKTFNTKVISIFQNINILMVYVGYIMWVMLSSVKLVLNPKDKNFSILRYKCTNIILIILFDIVLTIGATLFTLSGIYLFIYSCSFNDEIEFEKLKLSFFFLKYGFLLLIIGNSYYFGHYLLSLIFRPIAIQYTPYNLKNDYYIKANRKLKNFLNTRKNVKLRNV